MPNVRDNSASESANRYIVYLITNLVNGKFYVGVICKTLQERWKAHVRHSNSGSPLRFHKAIRKYGKDKFFVSSLAVAHAATFAAELETQYIRSLQSYKRTFGYNSALGPGLVPNEETRMRMSNAHRGKRRSVESILKSVAKTSGPLNGFYRHDLVSAELATLYRIGMSIPALARLYKASLSAVHSRLKKEGVTFRPIGNPNFRLDTPERRANLLLMQTDPVLIDKRIAAIRLSRREPAFLETIRVRLLEFYRSKNANVKCQH